MRVKHKTKSKLEIAYTTGRSDFYTGTKKANPYPKGSDEFQAWERGYTDESAANRQKFEFRNKNYDHVP